MGFQEGEGTSARPPPFPPNELNSTNLRSAQEAPQDHLKIGHTFNWYKLVTVAKKNKII